MHYFIMTIPNNKNFNKLHLIIDQILTLKIYESFYKKCFAKPYSFLVTGATLVSDNSFCFRNNIKTNYGN